MSIFLLIWLGGLGLVLILSFVHVSLLLLHERERARYVKEIAERLSQDVLPALVMAILLITALSYFLSSFLKYLKK